MSFFKKAIACAKTCAQTFLTVCLKGVFPVLLAAQAVVPLYLLGRVLTLRPVNKTDKAALLWATLPRERTTKMAIVYGFLCFFALLWVLPLAYCLFSTYWVALKRKEVPVAHEPLFKVDPDSKMREICRYCHSYRLDRSFHCHKRGLDKCLPFYDHTCAWWTGAIWLHNLKAYLLMLTMLPVFQLYILGVCIWMMASKNEEREIFRHWKPLCGLSAAGFFLSLSFTLNYWHSFIFWNTLDGEGQAGINFLDEYGSVCFWDPKDFKKNPYNKGSRQNAFDMLGPWYTWLLFWTETPLMDMIEDYRQEERDAPAFPLESYDRWSLVSPQVSTTGFDAALDIESGKLNRREGRHTYP